MEYWKLLFNKIKHLIKACEFCESTVVTIFHFMFLFSEWNDKVLLLNISLHITPSFSLKLKMMNYHFFLIDFFSYKSQCIIISQHRNYNLSKFWNTVKSLTTQIISPLGLYPLCTRIQGEFHNAWHG